MPFKKKEELHGYDSKDMHDLIDAMYKLTNRVDKMVLLFEDAAKHVGEVESTEARVNSLSVKLEYLLDQNKSIAQGLLLLEKYVRGKSGLTEQPPQLN